MREKLTIINSQHIGKQNTPPTKCKNSVRCYTLLGPFLCTSISGMLISMFVSGFCGLVSLPFYPQWSHSFQCVYALVCRSHDFGRSSMFLRSIF